MCAKPVLERVATASLLRKFKYIRPDLVVCLGTMPTYRSMRVCTMHQHAHTHHGVHQVIDPVFSSVRSACDFYNIPYVYLHTSGLPVPDSWNSFFVPKPTHVLTQLTSMLCLRKPNTRVDWSTNVADFNAVDACCIVVVMDNVVSNPLKRIVVKLTDVFLAVFSRFTLLKWQNEVF
jgi:hypothetical protein